MKYLAPERPKYEEVDRGKLLDERGNPLGVLPQLLMEPFLAAGSSDSTAEWHIHVHVPVRSGAWGSRQTTIAGAALVGFLQRWLDDPEEVLRSTFKYDFNVDTSQRPWGEAARKKASQTAVPLDALFGPGFLDNA